MGEKERQYPKCSNKLELRSRVRDSCAKEEFAKKHRPSKGSAKNPGQFYFGVRIIMVRRFKRETSGKGGEITCGITY